MVKTLNTPGKSLNSRNGKDKHLKPYKLYTKVARLAEAYFDGYHKGQDFDQYDREFEEKHLITVKGQRGWKI